MQAIVHNLTRLGRWAQGPAGYLMLVVLLPGGSLLALLLLLYRRREGTVRRNLARAASVIERAVFRPAAPALQPCYIQPVRTGDGAGGRR